MPFKNLCGVEGLLTFWGALDRGSPRKKAEDTFQKPGMTLLYFLLRSQATNTTSEKKIGGKIASKMVRDRNLESQGLSGYWAEREMCENVIMTTKERKRLLQYDAVIFWTPRRLRIASRGEGVIMT